MKLTKKQKSVVRRLIKVADEEGAGPKARKALIEAGLVESGLADLRHGDRDSEGVLQVRTGIHGANVARSVEESARRFLRRGFTGQGGAIELSKRLGSAGEVAQAVQGSAFPDRYAKRGGDADAILGGTGTGRASGGQDTVSTRTTTTTPGVDNSALRQQMLQQYVLSRGKPDALLGLARGLSGAQDVAPTTETSVSSRRVRKSQNPVSSGTRPSGQLTELFYDPVTGVKRGQKIGAVGGHADHVHVATGPKQLAAIKKLATDMGLTITSEDEGYDGDGVHTSGSYHYKKRAVDVAGPPERMAAFTKRVAKKYRVKL